MTDENFEKLDRDLRENLKPLSETPVPPRLLKGFSASVIRKIEAKAAPEREAGAFRGLERVWLVPTFAVLVLASTVLWRSDFWRSVVSEPTGMIQMASNVSTISEEIDALRDLGAWTEEDDASVEI